MPENQSPEPPNDVIDEGEDDRTLEDEVYDDPPTDEEEAVTATPDDDFLTEEEADIDETVDNKENDTKE